MQFNRQETADSIKTETICNIKLHLEERRAEAEQKNLSPKLCFN